MSADYDSDELQALFDEIATTQAPTATATATATMGAAVDGMQGEPPTELDLYQSIGNLVRRLHDALKETGQDSVLFQAESMLPESRERLTFIGDLMEKSATQCVHLTEQEMPRLEACSEALRVNKTGWDRVVSGHSTVEEFKKLALATPGVLQRTIDDQKKVKASLMDILMAQGFQDLAGQTLAKVILQVRGLERELLGLLALAASGNAQQGKISDFLDGPQFKKTEEAVHSQAEVDDLLKELGF